MLIVVTGEIGCQMRMGIHKARAKRCVAEINHTGRTRDRQTASCVNNLVTLHDDHTILQQGVRFAVKYSRSFQRDYFVSSARRHRQEENCNYTTPDFHALRVEATGEPCKRPM